MSGGSGVTLILFKLSLGVLLSHCCCSCCVRGFWCHIAVTHIVSRGSGVTLLLFKLSLGNPFYCHISVAHVMFGGSGVTLLLLTLCLGVLMSHKYCSN